MIWTASRRPHVDSTTSPAVRETIFLSAVVGALFPSSDAVSVTFLDVDRVVLSVVPSSVAVKTCLPILQGVRVSLFSGLI